MVLHNAPPFEAGKLEYRHEMAAQAVAQAGVPLVYANMVGGQDDIVFDGGSFIMSETGEVMAQAAEFEELLFIVDNPAHTQNGRSLLCRFAAPTACKEYMYFLIDL